MPRDGSGNYTLPAGNPVVTGTTISSTTANSTFSDLATAMTGSLSRSGLGGMLVPFANADGTAGSPGITWASETTSGFFRAGTNDQRVSIGGTTVSRWTATTPFLQVTLDGGATWKNPVLANNTTTFSSGTYNFDTGSTLQVQGVTVTTTSIPSQSGKTGQVLSTNGTSPLWSTMIADNGAGTVTVTGSTTVTLAAATSVVVSINGTTRATFASTGLTLVDQLKVGRGTATGTSVTINQPSGRVTMNAGGTSVTVSNTFCTTNSCVVIAPEYQTTGTSPAWRVNPGAGTFTVVFSVAYSNGDTFSFVLVN